MSKKLGPIFIDFNKTVAINIVRDGNNFNISITRNNNLAGNIGLNNYIRNLKRILKFEQAPDGKNLDIYLGKLKLGEITDYQMFGNLDVNTNYYNSIYLLTTTEVRMLSQGRLEDIEGIEIPFNRPPVDTNNHEAVNLPSPKTDLVNEFNKSKIKKYNVETEIDKSTKIKGVKTPLIYVKSSKKDDENYFVGVKGSNRGLFGKKITLPNGEERDCICIVPSATYKQVKGKDNKQDLRFGEVVKTVFNKFAAEKIVDTNQNINHI